jgi:hypothetical protein
MDSSISSWLSRIRSLLFLFQPIQAIIGDSMAWHQFAARLARQ